MTFIMTILPFCDKQYLKKLMKKFFQRRFVNANLISYQVAAVIFDKPMFTLREDAVVASIL